MRPAVRTLRLGLLGVSLAAPLGTFAAAAAAPRPPVSSGPSVITGDRAREEFLAEGDVVAVQDTPTGVTGSLRATLRRGDLSHDADIQMVDEESVRKDLGTTVELDFRDTYRHDVAAYRLDRMLGVGMVPVAVVRDHDRRAAAFTWWVDDVLLSEGERYVRRIRPPDAASWNRQLAVVGIFDQLIFNFDRNAGNLIIDRGWRLWMIDHSRAFKTTKSLRNPRALGDSCEKDLLAALRALGQAALRTQMNGLLSDGQIEGLVARRDHIVAHYDRLIADRGEAAILYDLPPRARVAR